MRPTILDAISCGVQAVPVPLYQPSTVQLPQFYMSCFPDLKNLSNSDLYVSQ